MMKDFDDLNNQDPTIIELQKENRSLKRKLALAEENLTRAKQINISQNRVEAILNSSLKKELQFFQLVLENMTNILLLLDFDGRFAYASNTFLAEAGYASFGLINGSHFKDVLKPLISNESLTRFSETVDRAVKQKSVVSLEEQIDFSSKGMPRVFIILVTPMTDEEGKSTGIMVLFNDVTEIKNALKAANRANHAKSEFLAKMSHEIRTPMNAIIGMAELALRENKLDTVREYVYTVKQASANLLSIINDILDFSKIESGKMEIIQKNYSLSSLLNDVISIIRMRAIDSQLQFIVNIDSNLQNALIGDEIRIRQVLINILGNAVKYTKEGFVLFSVSGEMVCEDSIILKMQVTDSGKGIKSQDIENIFKEYAQFDLEINKGTEGVGLGLAITNGLVKAMSGNINISSEYNKGSTFTVTLPQRIRGIQKLAVVEKPDTKETLVYEHRELYANSIAYAMGNLGVRFYIASDDVELCEKLSVNTFSHIFISLALYEKNKTIITKHGMKSKIILLTEFGEAVSDKGLTTLAMPVHSVLIANVLNGASEMFSYSENSESVVRFTAPDAKVLVVDDINTNLKVAKGLLLPYKMKTDLCVSGAEAIEAIKSKDYDVVLMDHMMPEMDGVEVTRLIRAMGDEDEYYKHVPIIALTANAVSGMEEMFLENGFDDFLAKPIDTVKLNTILGKWIRKEKQKSISENKDPAADTIITVQIEGLNVNKGVQMLGGKTDLYCQTLDVFQEDGLEKINEINEYLKTDNLPLYINCVHALKSALAYIGADELSETAKTLEMAGRSNDLEFINVNNGNFIIKLQKLLDNISGAMSSHSSNGVMDPPLIKQEHFKAEIANLKIAIDNMDSGVIDRTIDTLLKSARSDDVKTIVKNISRHILMAEYDEAAALTDSLLNGDQV